MRFYEETRIMWRNQMRTARWWESIQKAWEKHDPGSGIGGRWSRAVGKKKHEEAMEPTSEEEDIGKAVFAVPGDDEFKGDFLEEEDTVSDEDSN